MRFSQFIRTSASVAVLAALAVAGQAQAQDDDATRTVDEIIVTAQKREQSLQDVPVVVTAVGEQLLADTGVKDIKDLQILTPGLLVTSTSNETVTTARIRGIGTVGDNPGLESSVGIVIDGVYRPRNGVGFGDLGELERVEVLKGPQGTLFGKNTSAGVINIISKGPEREFGGQLELTAGNYGARGGSASITGPIGDNASGRLFFAKRQRDGLYDVRVGTGPRTLTEDATQDYTTVRGQLLLEPNDDVSILFIADKTTRDEACCVGVAVVRNPVRQGYVDTLATADTGVLNPPNPSARTAYSNRPTGQLIDDGGVSVQADVDLEILGGATFTSITAARNWSTVNGQDSDFTTADLIYRGRDNYGSEFNFLSQEFRLAGATDALDWLVGAFMVSEDLSARTELLLGEDYREYFSLIASGGLTTNAFPTVPTAFAPGTGLRDRFAQEAHSFALFTNNTFHVTDAFEITAGLRYTAESKTLDSSYSNVPGTLGCLALTLCVPWVDPNFANVQTTQERDEKEWSGTLKAAYRFNPDLMAYASYARGYKAGGFNLDRSRTLVSATVAPFFVIQPDTSFPGEFVDSYELGVKSSWFGRTLLLNAAAFHQTYTDFQLNTFTGISFIVVSMPEVVSYGIDTDFVWFAPIEGLSMQGGVTWSDTQFGDEIPTRDASNFCRPLQTGGACGAGSVGGGVLWRLPGSTMSFAPKIQASVSTTYEREVGDNLMFRGNLGVKYLSEYNTGSDLNPVKAQEAYALANARVSLGAADEQWAVEVWAQNITDEEYYQVVFDATLQNEAGLRDAVNAFMGQPRTYGVTLRGRF